MSISEHSGGLGQEIQPPNCSIAFDRLFQHVGTHSPSDGTDAGFERQPHNELFQLLGESGLTRTAGRCAEARGPVSFLSRRVRPVYSEVLPPSNPNLKYFQA